MSGGRASAFLLMDDVLAAGADALSAELTALGFDGVTAAVSYHDATDLRPRGATGRTVTMPAGAVYFPPDPTRYGEGLVAWAPPPFDETDAYAGLRAATDARGQELIAWTVFLHDGRLGALRPDCCQQNAFGDPSPADLCPANPDVRAYALALAADVVARHPDAVLAESLHFHPWRQWRRFVPLDAAARLALGLCFCLHCATAAAQAGVDVAAVRGWARDRIAAAFAGEVAETDAVLDGSAIAAAAGGSLAAFLALRARLVAELVAAVAERVHAGGARLLMMDQAGVEEPALSVLRHEEALRYGVDPAGLVGVVDGWQVLAYGADVDLVGRTVAGYRRLLPGRELRATVRPAVAGSEQAAGLSARIEGAVAAGADAVDFYNLSLAPARDLARAGSALATPAVPGDADAARRLAPGTGSHHDPAVSAVAREALVSTAPRSEFELLIAGARVVDGTGAEPVRADLGIADGRIAALGDLADRVAAETLDAAGLLVFPGFIDVHVHADALLATPRVQEAMLRQGITSAVLGQDGVSFAPSGPRGFDYANSYFAAVNGRAPGGVGPGGILEYLERLVAGSAVNVGFLVPAGTVRAEVVGLEERPATPAELGRMTALVAEAVAAGALGLSTGLDYVPGGFATTAELIRIAAPVGAVGGAIVSHLRGYASERIGDSLPELARIAADVGARGHASHLHGQASRIIPLLERAAAARHPLSFDSYPYLRGATLLAMVALPAGLQAGGTAATVARLADPVVRAELRSRWFPANPRLGRMHLSFVSAPEFAWAEGLELTQAAARHDGDLAEFVADVLVASELAVGCVVDNGTDRALSDVRELMRRPEHMGSSDGIYLGGRPHPRGWGAFARALGHHVRELGDWSWGEAGFHLAGHAAQRFGLAGRGVIEPGAVADLALVDPGLVADASDYDTPILPAVGVPHVLVAGRFAVRGGHLTAQRPGRVLRRSPVPLRREHS